jgi:hypothetical protein
MLSTRLDGDLSIHGVATRGVGRSRGAQVLKPTREMVDGPCVVDATLSRWATLGKGVWSLLDAAVGALLLFDADGRAVAGEIDSFQQSNRYLLPDGGTVWGLLTMTIVRDANGTPQPSWHRSRTSPLARRRKAGCDGIPRS